MNTGSTRRRFLTRVSRGVGAMALVTVIPSPAHSETLELPDRVSNILDDAFGSSILTQGKISLELPILAETGLSVPVTFSVDSHGIPSKRISGAERSFSLVSLKRFWHQLYFINY